MIQVIKKPYEIWVEYESRDDFKEREQSFTKKFGDYSADIMINCGDTNTRILLIGIIVHILKKYSLYPTALFQIECRIKQNDNPDVIHIRVLQFYNNKGRVDCGFYWTRSDCIVGGDIVKNYIEELMKGEIIHNLPPRVSHICKKIKNRFVLQNKRRYHI